MSSFMNGHMHKDIDAAFFRFALWTGGKDSGTLPKLMVPSFKIELAAYWPNNVRCFTTCSYACWENQKSWRYHIDSYQGVCNGVHQGSGTHGEDEAKGWRQWGHCYFGDDRGVEVGIRLELGLLNILARESNTINGESQMNFTSKL